MTRNITTLRRTLKQSTSTLIHHLYVVLAMLMLAATTAAAQTPGHRSLDADQESARRKIGSPVKHPTAITTVEEMGTLGTNLTEWGSSFFEGLIVGEAQQTWVEGYSALVLTAVVDDELQRVMAIDLGNGTVLLHRTTDDQASDEDLAEVVKSNFQGTLMAVRNSAAVTNYCNCVLYARSQVPSLPYGLDTLASKIAIINHRFPRVGSVAVHNYSPDGHVSVVRNVVVQSDGNLYLTIDEANYKSCEFSRRYGTPDGLNIVGYYDPTYPSGQSSPKLDSLSTSTGAAGRPFIVTAYGSGFDPYSVRAVILGPGCSTFNSCVVPNGALSNRSSSSAQVPLTLNNRGAYHLYLSNASSGKTSNGKKITIY